MKLREDERSCCESCRWAGTCAPLADLQSLVLNRPYLEADYGWDVFGFIAEAKGQYRNAKARNCTVLDDVRKKAAELAPTVDFSRVE